jgi:hypothetical protein
MYLRIILILYLINNVQLCFKEKKYSYIEVPIVLVTSTGKLNHLINTINNIEYHNAANTIITVNIKIIDIIYTDKSYNNITNFYDTKDYLHIFYVDQYVAYDNSIHTNFVRRSDESLNDYITFDNDTYIKERKHVPYEMLDYNKYIIHFNKTTNFIKFYDKKLYIRESVIIFGNNDINKTIPYINIAISKQIKNLKNIGKDIYKEKIELYNNNQKNKLFINNYNKYNDDRLLNEYAIYKDNFKIIACDTNPNNKKHCCSELNDFTDSDKYSLIVNSNNEFIIVPVIKNDIVKNDKFILPIKNVHFNIEYSCDNKICYNMYNIIKESIDELNNIFYNVKVTCSKSENKYSTNLKIKFVNNIIERNNLTNTVPAEQTFGSVYYNDIIRINIVNKNNNEIIKKLIKHGIVSHAFEIGHENGQKYTQLTAAFETGILISEKYFVFGNISPFFEINNKETNNIKTNNCKTILNTITTTIKKCTDYFEFSMIKNHKKQKIEIVNKNMYDNLQNKIKIYSSLYDALNNLFTDALIVDKNDLEYIDYNNEYKCGFINSKCVSIAKVKYNSKIYYINLGNYNSILSITKDNYVICCINGILCNSLSNNSTNINQHYRNHYFNNY